MSLEAVIQENTQAIRDLIAHLAKGQSVTSAQVAAVVEQAPAEQKTEKAKPAKSEKKVEEKKSETGDAPTAETPSSSTTKDVESSTDQPQAEEKPQPTYDDAAKAVVNLSKQKGRAAAVELLSKFSASSLKEVDAEKYADVIAEAEKMAGA